MYQCVMFRTELFEEVVQKVYADRRILVPNIVESHTRVSHVAYMNESHI